MKFLAQNTSLGSKMKNVPCPACQGKKHHIVLHRNVTVAVINCFDCKGTGKLIADKRSKQLAKVIG